MSASFRLPTNLSVVVSEPFEAHNYEHSGGDGGGEDMLQRIKDLEKDTQQMKTDIAIMRSNYATKTDVSDAKNSIILWVVGAVVFAQLIPTLPAIINALKTLSQ